jgi:hypothetical protein
MRRHLLLLSLVVALGGCLGSGEGPGLQGPLPNDEPVADAGPDQTVAVGDLVTLDGSASDDFDGDPLTYAWTLTSVPAGSTAALSDPAAISPTFTADLAGDYVATLVVNDGTVSSLADTVTITAVVVDLAPLADAGADQLATVGAPVTLDATGSSDPEAGALTYLWTVVAAPAGSSAALDDATLAQPQFTPDVAGSWSFSVEVSDGNTTSTATVEVTTIWRLNLAGNVAPIFTNTDASPVLVDVQSLDLEVQSGVPFWVIVATGIPSYQHTLTAADITFLNTVQPDSKFVNNSGTTLTAGTVVALGTDVGYKVIDACFASTGGGGWFPPGPTCPQDQQRVVYLPVTPEVATQTCYTQVDAIGVYRNGVAMFNWSDAQSFNDEQVWHQLAAKFEVKDLDVCSSHANQSGDYHHHLNPNCLAEQLGDAGTSHSPIYGYAADGYPIHGVWQANGVKAQSCWKVRDYDTPGTTGCGTSKQRTCLLVDRLDPSQGTVAAAAPGPDTDAVEISEGGDAYTVESGYYFEDYYFDATCAAAGGEFLDEHNGHDHDAFGYHYHQTESFPYNVGPEYRGRLFPNSVQGCSTSPAQ